MRIYRIELLQIPKILFAHSSRMTDTTLYKFPYETDTRRIEFTFVEEGELTRDFADGTKVAVPAGGLACLASTQNYYAHCEAPVHRHISAHARTNFAISEVDEREVVSFMRRSKAWTKESPHVVFIPDFLPPGPGLSRAEKILRKLVFSWTDLDGTREMECAGIFLELCAEITQATFRLCLQEADAGVTPGSASYVQRAMQYISSNLHRPISVKEIADNLHISSHYIGSLFKAVTGQTLIEYINRSKIEKVKVLLSSNSMSLRQAGEEVGIRDENYLGRLFKKYAGITVREFRLPSDATQAKIILPDEEMTSKH